ncbi:MAG: hypothetical protein K5764_01885, partial [Prevotella sp.]|nr:hypothetical protein [Prevotella sp.]
IPTHQSGKEGKILSREQCSVFSNELKPVVLFWRPSGSWTSQASPLRGCQVILSSNRYYVSQFLADLKNFSELCDEA